MNIIFGKGNWFVLIWFVKTCEIFVLTHLSKMRWSLKKELQLACFWKKGGGEKRKKVFKKSMQLASNVCNKIRWQTLFSTYYKKIFFDDSI